MKVFLNPNGSKNSNENTTEEVNLGGRVNQLKCTLFHQYTGVVCFSLEKFINVCFDFIGREIVHIHHAMYGKALIRKRKRSRSDAVV